MAYIRKTKVVPEDLAVTPFIESLSNEFLNANLTLIVIGVGELVSICDSLYADAARNTGKDPVFHCLSFFASKFQVENTSH